MGDRRKPLCEHGPEDGCWRCCPNCNVDRHRCPGCGKNVPHGTHTCSDCKSWE